MDESRPRHRARRLPLIIERPDLAHPLRRVSAVVITALAWLLWLAMWVPFLFALGRHFGYDLPEILFPSQISLATFLSLVQVMPYVVGVAVLVFLVGALRERLKARIGTADDRWRPVGIDRLATGAALDPEQLAAWQKAQILYVEHGPRGRVTNAGG
ncbi:MAG TPA: poly-beta-1,6-N-acetyl-D-glucosamine biosynthesis protein PgaD [Candidatus Accumulibacter phosphatis]|nr:poly-beta-1,6-N-acetyl-D-glucosamine biosynthesis protein PgaD [Candidatus Accumulibacter phosphatis]HRQ97290.1 poly-beta-1,6-N-acetyl-D-glucosamine biosynthesis protein PgaD [Candidatus Accumulibacter phosphatis]